MISDRLRNYDYLRAGGLPNQTMPPMDHDTGLPPFPQGCNLDLYLSRPNAGLLYSSVDCQDLHLQPHLEVLGPGYPRHLPGSIQHHAGGRGNQRSQRSNHPNYSNGLSIDATSTHPKESPCHSPPRRGRSRLRVQRRPSGLNHQHRQFSGHHNVIHAHKHARVNFRYHCHFSIELTNTNRIRNAEISLGIICACLPALSALTTHIYHQHSRGNHSCKYSHTSSDHSRRRGLWRRASDKDALVAHAQADPQIRAVIYGQGDHFGCTGNAIEIFRTVEISTEVTSA